MINLITNYITNMLQDSLVNTKTLLILASIGVIPFLCVCICSLYCLQRVSNKTLMFLVSLITLMYALTYTHKLILLLANGYNHNDLLRFFVLLSGSIAAIVITIAYARKYSRKTIHFHKNGIAKECEIIKEKENKNV